MSGVGPQNARTVNGVRVYTWIGPDGEPVDVLSVTSIRKLCGESMNLVAWQIANVVNLAMGTRRVTFVGPRGGVREKYVPDGAFPGEFVRRLLETEGGVEKLAEVRRWLRESADEPRDVAAVRGSVVHKCIEVNVRPDQLSDEYVLAKFEEQWAGERGRRKTKRVLLDDDYHFVRNAMRQYFDMREHVPFVILAQEPQVWNLTAGYAGSFDVLIWFLGTFDEDGTFHPLPDQDVHRWQMAASAGKVTIETIQRIGGTLVLGDWKTAKDTHTDHAVQTTAYLAGEFVGRDGVVDERMTALLRAAMYGALFHIRPDGWGVQLFRFREDVLRAFLGSCAFARFLARYPDVGELMDVKIEGKAPDTEDSQYGEDAA